MSTRRAGTASRQHYTAGTAERRDSTRGRVRALTVLTTAGTLLGTAGVAWDLAPEATAATPPPPRPATQPAHRATPVPARPKPAATRTSAPAPAPVTSSGAS